MYCCWYEGRCWEFARGCWSAFQLETRSKSLPCLCARSRSAELAPMNILCALFLILLLAASHLFVGWSSVRTTMTFMRPLRQQSQQIKSTSSVTRATTAIQTSRMR